MLSCALRWRYAHPVDAFSGVRPVRTYREPISGPIEFATWHLERDFWRHAGFLRSCIKHARIRRRSWWERSCPTPEWPVHRDTLPGKFPTEVSHNDPCSRLAGCEIRRFILKLEFADRKPIFYDLIPPVPHMLNFSIISFFSTQRKTHVRWDFDQGNDTGIIEREELYVGGIECLFGNFWSFTQSRNIIVFDCQAGWVRETD